MVQSSRRIYKLLGEAVRAQRKRARLSQEELAEKADFTRNYIGDIERGGKKPQLTHWQGSPRPSNVEFVIWFGTFNNPLAVWSLSWDKKRIAISECAAEDRPIFGYEGINTFLLIIQQHPSKLRYGKGAP